MGREAKHSSDSSEHYTPKEIVEAARHVLGDIQLDPASSVAANRVVKAKKIYTRHGDGLKQKWQGRVFLNPPGGSFDRAKPTWSGGVTRSSQVLWWDHCVHEYEKGRVSGAIFVAFSVEILQTAQTVAGLAHPMDFVVCFPRQRIRFDKMKEQKRVSGKQPTHANMIIFLPMGRRVRRWMYSDTEALKRVQDQVTVERKAAKRATESGFAEISEFFDALEELELILGRKASASSRVAQLREWVDEQKDPWWRREMAYQVRNNVGFPGYRRQVDTSSVERFVEAFSEIGKVCIP